MPETARGEISQSHASCADAPRSDLPQSDVAVQFQPAQSNTEWLDDELLPRVYDQLRRVAAQCLRQERSGHTLQPTALVHEVYLRLAGSTPLAYETPAHLIRIVGRLMRQILVEYARRRNAARRGSGVSPLSLIECALPSADSSQETIFLDQALQALEKEDARKSQIIELHYFGGFTTEDIAHLTRL